MSPSLPLQNPLAPWRDSILLAGLALAVYLTLGQHTLHGDGFYFLTWALRDQTDHPNHFAYLPILVGFKQLCSWLDLPLYRAALLLSQLTCAAAVLLFHRASSALLPRREAFWLTATIAASPSVVYFGTVVELHAPFLMACGVVACATSALVRQPSLGRAARLGLTTGIAFLFHSTGQILPWPMLLLVLGLLPRLRHPRAFLPMAVSCAVCHGAIVLGAPILLRRLGFSIDPTKSAGFVQFWAEQSGLQVAMLAQTLWTEWLAAFAPCSVLWVVGFARPGLRGQALAFLLSLLPYLAAAFLILGLFDEHGAYLQPLAWPVGLLVCRALPRAVLPWVALAALLIAVITVRGHDKSDPAAWAREVRAVCGPKVLLIIGTEQDFEGAFVGMPEAAVITVSELDQQTKEQRPQAYAALIAGLRHQIATGVTVILTRGSEQLMAHGDGKVRYPSLEIALSQLRQALVLEPVGGASFQGLRLRLP